MKKYLLILLLLPLAISCNKEYPEPENKKMIGTNNAFVLQTRYISHQGNEMIVEMDVGAFIGGMAYDQKNLGDSAFKDMVFPINKVEVQDVQRVHLQENRTYANLVLIDAGEGYFGTWDDFDVMNLKVRALNRYLQEAHADPAKEVGLATFSRDISPNGYSSWIWKEGNAFSQTYEEHGKILFNLKYNLGGTSSLYDALDGLIDYVVNNSTNPNKNITVVTHSVPDIQNISYSAVLKKAQENNVTINMLTLNDGYRWNQISLPLRSGGFVNMVSSTQNYTLNKAGPMDKGTTLLSAMDRVLSRNLHVYRVRLKLTRNSGTWQSGNQVYNYYEINERYADGSNRINNIIPFYVTIP